MMLMIVYMPMIVVVIMIVVVMFIFLVMVMMIMIMTMIMRMQNPTSSRVLHALHFYPISRPSNTYTGSRNRRGLVIIHTRHIDLPGGNHSSTPPNAFGRETKLPFKFR